MSGEDDNPGLIAPVKPAPGRARKAPRVLRTNAELAASSAQNSAADPALSSFVSANAGSGKTRVLTNRISRLLLRGVDPHRILCLTFTRAAAGEIKNRIFERLGAWVMQSEDRLREELEAIGERPPDDEELIRARRLFARALEAQGGLRIETIHGFCASLLRSFPIEAGVPARFRELEEETKSRLLQAALDRMIEEEPERYHALQNHYTIDAKFADNIVKCGRGFLGIKDAPTMARALGEEYQSAKDIIAAFSKAPMEEALGLADHNARPHWHDFHDAKEAGENEKALEHLHRFFHTGKGEIRACIEGKKNDFGAAHLAPAQAFIAAGKAAIQSYGITQYTDRLALLAPFARSLFARFEHLKSAASFLDYDDMIHYARALLEREDGLSWVMYRLDGAIEHILVDEAQDTNKAQWAVIDAIAKGFADDDRRSLLVVGDEKQSIFSFQGTDPGIFSDKSGEYGDALKGRYQEVQIPISFRSAPLVLEFVDRVFAGETSAGFTGDMAHSARAEDLPGAIELWPFRPIGHVDEEAGADKSGEWPVPNFTPDAGEEINFARDIAAAIAGDIRAGLPIASDDGVRPLRAGDFLILLPKRSNLFYALQKFLADEGVPIAGVDVLKLNDELAVRDALAPLRVAALPGDDLSLGAFLRSPLGGLSEAELFALASNRGDKTLLEALHAQKDRYGAACELIERMIVNARSQGPFALLTTLLSELGGERKLTLALGATSGEALSNLLDLALRYEEQDGASLTGFLAHFDALEHKIRRSLDGSGDVVRVMSIHGAKGLEAPIVVLPIINAGDGSDARFALGPEGISLERVNKKEIAPKAVRDYFDGLDDIAAQEKRRLLYVALTRAKSKLVLCGLGKDGTARGTKQSELEAYELYGELKAAFDGLDLPVKEFTRLSKSQNEAGFIASEKRQNWEEMAIDQGLKDASGKEEMRERGEGGEPRETPRSCEPTKEQEDHQEGQAFPAIGPIGLSELLPEYEAITPLGDGRAKGPEKRGGADYGELLHRFCEILPNHDLARWDEIAGMIAPRNADRGAIEDALDECRSLFARHPDLLEEGWLREQDFSITIEGVALQGRIDAARIGENIRIIDFKTNRAEAARTEDLPQSYQMQMAVYGEAFRQHYPQKAIKAEILWTKSGDRLEFSAADLENFLARFRQKLLAGNRS